MKLTIVALLLAAGAVALAVGPASPVPAPPQAARIAPVQSNEPAVVCGFRNPSHAGLCEERAPFEKGKKLELICKPILDCLNDTRCIKTYCGATTVRQGWVLESATRAE
jgi:hypothetical protein